MVGTGVPCGSPDLDCPNLVATRGVLPTSHSGQYGGPGACLGWLPTKVGEGDLEHGIVFEEAL